MRRVILRLQYYKSRMASHYLIELIFIFVIIYIQISKKRSNIADRRNWIFGASWATALASRQHRSNPSGPLVGGQNRESLWQILAD